jgi:[ribosomal protein S18]-alanine N-acetyltransferase
LGVGTDAVVSTVDLRSRGHAPLPLTLEEMRRCDLDVVVALERRTFAQPWSADQFLRELGLRFSRIILARTPSVAGPELVGYVCHWLNAEEVEIQNVAVAPEWRRRAVARRLIEYVLAEASEAGAQRATLEVRVHNHPAIRLYRTFGFREIGCRRGYYTDGEDALLMELRIDRGGR